eukprot:TRINITY_DN18563_c0_g1_i1.p1 TRINITY_DN18563_c0_g1~~TRINITY_DN18563_c0_g1_i1.p1  ORF type:complete len:351 (+),score=57.12 TRINITY_DN18563_c0_g1_i1:96-1148(+)
MTSRRLSSRCSTALSCGLLRGRGFSAFGGGIRECCPRRSLPSQFQFGVRHVAASVEERTDVVDQVFTTGAMRPRGEAPPTLRQMRVGFLGWGAMAQAVSLGMVRKNLTESNMVMACDIEPKLVEAAAAEGLRTTMSNQELVEWSDIVIIAVKPQVAPLVTNGIAPYWNDKKLFVSICAGITIGAYQEALGSTSRVVRVMPNTPCLIGEAATAFAGSKTCGEFDLDLVHMIFDAVGGATHRLPENLLDTVTGLSGSGPAYVFMFIQALSDAGVHGGLPRKVATSLACQTVAGAARMVQETGSHPSVLKEAVTSPAGTTIAAVRLLERSGFNSSVIEAVEAAKTRSEEMSKA